MAITTASTLEDPFLRTIIDSLNRKQAFNKIIESWKKRKAQRVARQTKYTIDEIVASNPMTNKYTTIINWTRT